MNPGLRLRQDLRQKLELQLTPRQILQNEILMLPLNALRETLEQEVEENVFLKPGAESSVQKEAPAEAPAAETPEANNEPLQLEEAGAFHEYLRGNRGSNGGVGRESGEERNLEGFITRPQSWREDLIDQLRVAPTDQETIDAAVFLVEWLNDRGHLEESLEAISESNELDTELLESALLLIQEEAPPGIGARNIQERILLQLKALPDRNRQAENIVQHCYEDLLKGRFAKIQKRLNMSEEQLLEAMEVMRHIALESVNLESDNQAMAIEPDATIVKNAEGRWVVEVHHGGLPPIRISNEVAAMCSKASNLDEETKNYLQAKLSRARWMREAIERRRSTIRRIIEEVVNRQYDFFDLGPEALVPLRQEEVATVVELHPSRVSRAIQDKYIETPFGVYPLKKFFPRGILNSDGDNVARDSVQHILLKIVEAEDPNKPLSDDALVQALTDRRVSISRRTVCKYRDELSIPPASARKGIYHKLKRRRR